MAVRATPKASVVVVTHNGLRHLDGCLATLSAQELDGGFEVLMVDNGSSDGSATHVESRFQSVRVLRAGSNLGFAGGNNLGIRASRGELIVLLNDDTTVRPGWLLALVAAADSQPTAGAVSSKVVFSASPFEIDSAGLVLRADGVCEGRGSNTPDEGQFQQREQVFAACGNGMLLRRHALDRVGLLDEHFFAYVEDVDLCWRMRHDGWIVLYEPDAVIDHVSSATSGVLSDLYHFLVLRNRFLTLVKNGPWGLVGRSLAGFGALMVRSAAGELKRRIAPWSNSGVHPARPPLYVQLRVVRSLVGLLPAMLASRRTTRGRRKLSDEQLKAWLQPVTEDWYERMDRLAVERMSGAHVTPGTGT